MWFKDLFKKEKENNKMEKFEHIKLKCKNCNDIIEGDGKGTYISCTCGKVAVDEVAPYYTRMIGNEGDFEVIRDNQKSLYEEALEKCKNNEEMWVKIKGFENYELSNLGNARKVNKDGTYSNIGYLDKTENRIKIQLVDKNKKIKMTTLSSLMGKTFEIPNPKNRKQIMPNDGDTLNCRLDNLKYRHNKDREEKLEVEYSDKDRIDKELLNKKPEPLNKEIWKDVIGYERWYEVSSLGNVRRLEKDGASKILKPTERKGGKVVSLKTTGDYKQFVVSHLVAEAFNIKPTEDNSRIIYHIDVDINNDCYSNLTYDRKETEAYIEEQRKLKEEQERLEKENQKEELKNYFEENKVFLKEAKERNSEVTIKDVYNKLCEILEVLKK